MERARRFVYARLPGHGGAQILRLWDCSPCPNSRPTTTPASVLASVCCWWFPFSRRFGFGVTNPARYPPVHSTKPLPMGADLPLGFAGGLLHGNGNGYVGAHHCALLSVVAAVVAHRPRAIGNRSPLVVARDGRCGFGFGFRRFDRVAGPPVVAGQNPFGQGRGPMPGSAFAGPRAEGLHRLFRTIRLARLRPCAVAAGDQSGRIHWHGR